MLSMQRTAAAVGHRTLSGATALVFGGGLALYQLTSLVLGPPAARQLHLSLNIPLLEPTDRAETVAPNVTVVLGTAAPVVGRPSPAGRSATPRHGVAVTAATVVPPSVPTIPVLTVTPVPSAAPRPTDGPRPHGAPTPQPPGDDVAD
jgi:hypothetical protein